MLPLRPHRSNKSLEASVAQKRDCEDRELTHDRDDYDFVLLAGGLQPLEQGFEISVVS